MLKKSLHIIISFIHLVSTTGLTISKHYAMGKLFDVSIVGAADHCCPVGCGCCHDEVEFHKLEVEFVGSDVRVSFDEIPTLDLMINTLLFDVKAEMDLFTNNIEFANNHPPPLISSIPSFTQSFLL